MSDRIFDIYETWTGAHIPVARDWFDPYVWPEGASKRCGTVLASSELDALYRHDAFRAYQRLPNYRKKPTMFGASQ